MSHDSDLNTLSDRELRILHLVKKALTNVAKDTQVPPGMRHPLAEKTINKLRNCPSLILTREPELVELQDLRRDSRPRFSDEPPDTVVVEFSGSGRSEKK